MLKNQKKSGGGFGPTWGFLLVFAFWKVLGVFFLQIVARVTSMYGAFLGYELCALAGAAGYLLFAVFTRKRRHVCDFLAPVLLICMEIAVCAPLLVQMTALKGEELGFFYLIDLYGYRTHVSDDFGFAQLARISSSLMEIDAAQGEYRLLSLHWFLLGLSAVALIAEGAVCRNRAKKGKIPPKHKKAISN